MRLHVLLLGAVLLAGRARTEELKIPPVTTSLDVKGQAVKITASASVSNPAPGAFTLTLTADLSDLQQNITALLASQLNRSDRCGERLSVEHAVLAPAAPAAILTANVRYERFTCIKAFGKEAVKRLVGGNGVLELKLTPSIGTDGISMASNVQKIDADGSLGELLRSGQLGSVVKDKIASGVESAIRKGLDLKSALPAAVADGEVIRSAQFASGPDGRLWITAAGEVHLSPAQFQSLAKQLQTH